MTQPTPDLIVFDGTCVFCSSFARFVSWADRDRRFAFVTSQSDMGRAICEAYDIDPDDPESNIVRVGSDAFLKMRAFTKVMKVVGWPWKAMAVLDLMPRPLSDWLYDRIARNRYLFGRRACPIPSAALRERLIE